MATNAIESRPETGSWTRQRRCVNRTCGRRGNKVEDQRCDSCGRSTKWAYTAFLRRSKRR